MHHHVAPFSAPNESVFAVLASSARRLSGRELASIAAASGIVALAAATLGNYSWMLFGACYVVWCFAGWGILFRTPAVRSGRLRALEWILVGSATMVFAALGIAVFFWTLGSHWQL
jgi:hypothetical protein